MHETIKVLDKIILSEFDHDLNKLETRLKSVKRPFYSPEEKIVVLHYDQEHFYQDSKLGFSIYNLLSCWRWLDIPFHALLIITNYPGYKQTIEQCYPWNNNDCPLVVENMINTSSYAIVKNMMSYNFSKTISQWSLCMMGMPRSQRMLLYKWIQHNSLFDKILTNYNSASFTPNLAWNAIVTVPHRYKNTEFATLRHDQLVDIDRVELPQSRTDPSLSGNNFQDWYRKCFFEIVSESVYDCPYTYVTDKTLKPILAKTPFVVFGPTGSLGYLRSLGFQTFGKFWNEDYDNIADPQLRFIEVCNTIRSILQIPLSDLQGIYNSMRPLLDHNRQCLMEYIDTRYHPMVTEYKL